MGFFSRLRATVFSQPHEQSLDREIEFHVEMRAAELEAAGMPLEEARRQARLRFGNRTLEREQMRNTGRLLWIEHVLQDVRFGLRAMRKTPLVTGVAILSLALGIGANTAIFTVLDALLLKTLPVKDAEQVVFLSWSAKKFPNELIALHGKAKSDAGGATSSTAFSYPFFEEMSRRTKAIAGLAGFVSLMGVPVMADGKSGTANAQAVSGGYYATLEVSPPLGRPIDESDDRSGAPAVAMLGYRFWQSRFGGDPAVLGKPIAIHNVPCTIIGVEPAAFLGLTAGEAPDVIVPLHRLPDIGKEWHDADSPIFFARDYWWLRIAARLSPGVAEARARQELGALFHQAFPQTAEVSAQELPALEIHHSAEGADDLRERFEQPLLVLMSVVGVVLLIACANVGNLLLARAHARQKETAMRMALGASRGRLIRQYLTESVLLSTIGGAFGLALAYWASSALVAALPTFGDALVFDLRPDVRILAFTAAASVLTGLLFGLAPAFQAARADLQPSLQASRRMGRTGIAQLLVVAQLAASVVVLTGAGLYVRTLHNLRQLDTGMSTQNVLAFRVEPVSAAGYTSQRAAEFYRRVFEKLPAIPGVRGATLARMIPLSGMFHRVPVDLPGVPPPAAFEDHVAGVNMVGPHFFETMGIPLRLGREIDERDQDSKIKVAVINESLARIHFPNQSPIGRRFRAGEMQPTEYEVIGVAADTKFHALRRDFGPGFFPCWSQHTGEVDSMSFELRTAGDVAPIVAAVRRAVSEIDPAVPVLSLMTLDEQIEGQLKQERLFAQVSTAFGLLALVLASVGLYGVRSYSVSRRTAEIGIRMALGATRAEIAALVMRETAGLTAAGVAIGLAAGLALTGVIRSMLFGIAPHDPATFVGAALVLTMVAAMAGYLPARRAARVDPMVALRTE